MSDYECPTRNNGKPSLNRRALVGGAAAVGVGVALGGAQGSLAQQATPITVDAGTPPAGIFESLQTYPLVTEKTTFKIMITDEEGQRVDNSTTKWLEELTGVAIEWLVVPAAGAIEQLNLQLASGDLPDAYMGLIWTPIQPTQLAVYGAQGFFIDLKDLIAENALNFNAQSQTLPQAVSLVTAPDGAIYSLPQINDCYHCSMPQKFWINKAWLDQLGLAIPTTPDELKAALQAFKDGNPNGKGDVLPMTVTATTSLGDLDAFLMNPFQLSTGEPWRYVDAEGKVQTSYTQEGWRGGVKYMRDLYAAGLLDNNSFVQTEEQMHAKTKNPEYAVAGAFPSFWKATHVEFDAPYFKEYVAIPQLVGPTGLQQTTRTHKPGNVGGLMITSACKDPALLIKYVDTLYTTEGTLRAARGKPGLNWAWAKEGEIGINGEPAIWSMVPQPPNLPDDLPHESWQELCPLWFSSDLRLSQAVIKPRDEETETILFDATKEMQEPWGMAEASYYPPVFYTEDQASVIALNETGVIDVVKSQYAQWVTGEGDPDADWEGYIEALNAVGYAEVLQTYQDAYDSRG